jgi:hypothetical protein
LWPPTVSGHSCPTTLPTPPRCLLAPTRNLLKTAFPMLKTYMLSLRQVIDTMTLKHGVATSDDVSALKEPLASLSNLPNNMNLFLLASQRLTRSGQGETDFDFFKLFLETVSGFLSVALVCRDTTYSTRLYCSRAWRHYFRTSRKCRITWSGPTQPPHFPASPKATPSKLKRLKRQYNGLPVRQWSFLHPHHHPPLP